MDFSARVDELQQRVAATKSAVQAAATESREQLRQRIDQAQQDAKDAQQRAEQRADQTADRARGKWAQMKADAAAKLDDFEAKMDRRADQHDAKVAARQADGAEADAADAIEFAAWTVDHARLAVLDAIDARVNADQLAQQAAR
jgi:DNA anti-recombination protein RmuC